MPELPEVECTIRALAPHTLGRRVARVHIARPDYVTGPASPRDLLQRDTPRRTRRLGKHAALIADSGRVLMIHLGMTGQWFFLPPRRTPPRPDHIHLRWDLADESGQPAGSLFLRDPRRFGLVETLPDEPALDARWAHLGPDALHAQPDHLRNALRNSRAPVKARLLDQSVLAGLGNIYADEACFLADIAPHRRARTLRRWETQQLAHAIRAVLRRAIDNGGSTLRDYVNGEGMPGTDQQSHLVYGRAHQPCTRCRTTLRAALIAQRTTVWCPACQPTRPRARANPRAQPALSP
jgi:formamidopyrimidine-DNA glycosylase